MGPTEKSEFEVKCIKIDAINPHPNADRLELVVVDGCTVIIRKGDFAVGSSAIYISIDAILPTDRPEFKFLAHEGKTSHRLKAVKLRGVFSMGLLIPVPDGLKSDTDLMTLLGITKYIPVSERESANMTGAGGKQPGGKQPGKYKGPKLPVYGLDPLRKFPNVLQAGERVVVSEKLHGTNARFVYVDGKLWVASHKVIRGCSRSRIAEFFNRTWLKLKSLLGVQHRAHTLQAIGDCWWEQAEALGLKEKLAQFPNMLLIGEIYGKGVQDLTYNSPEGRKFRAFDVYDLKNERYLDFPDFLKFIQDIGLDVKEHVVPILHTDVRWGPDQDAKWRQWANTAATSLGGVHLAEGVVIKPYTERYDPHCGRVGLKFVGESYLLSRKDE